MRSRLTSARHARVPAALLSLALASAPPAAARVTIGSASVRIENATLAREIALLPHLATTAIENRLSGRRFAVSGDELALHIAGRDGPLRARDLAVAGPPRPGREGGGVNVTIPLRHGPTGLELDVVYSLADAEPWLRKRLVVRAGTARIDAIEVERLRFAGAALDPPEAASPPPGQPVFVAGELFLALEHPAGLNRTGRDGLVAAVHHPGRSGTVPSQSAVLGVAADRPNARVRDAFLDYIAAGRPQPLRRFTVWDAYQNDLDSQVRARFEVAREVFARRGVRLDAALMDGGWTDPKSVMRPAAEPAGRLALVRDLARGQLGAALGLHVIATGGRATVDHAWLRRRFDMASEVDYCLADSRALEALRRSLLALVREHDVAAFKLDWARLSCDRAGHRGHLAGEPWGREAVADAYIDLLAALRAARPGIFLYDAGWLSPFWLLHLDAVFSGDGDYNTTLSGPPARSENDFQSTWRDGVLWKNLREPRLAFPLGGLMNHAPINWGWENGNVVFPNPLDRFSDMLVMDHLRGPALVEYYLNLRALGEAQRDALAAVASWAERHSGLLLADGRFALGDPRRAEPYGYAHFSASGEGLVAVRNPGHRAQDARLALGEELGVRMDGGPLIASVVYPYFETLPEPVAAGATLPLVLAPWETRVLWFAPVAATGVPLPLGARYEVEMGPAGELTYTVLGAASPSIAFSDGIARPLLPAAPAGSPPPRGQVSASTAAITRPAPGVLLAELRADLPRGIRARLTAVQWTETIAAQAGIHIAIRAGGVELPAERTTNGARDRGPRADPGWVLADAELPGSGPLEVEVRAASGEAPGLLAGELPFACREGCDPASRTGRRFEIHLRWEEPLAVAGTISVARRHGSPAPPWGLPGHSARVRHNTLLLADLEHGVDTPGEPPGIFRVEVGARPWNDRPYTILAAPAEVVGLPALRLSHEQAKLDAAQALALRVPARVYVAFGPDNPADEWLDPEPGWTLLARGVFRASVENAGRDVFYRDFPAGDHRLFAGRKGNWVPLGVAARQ